MKSQQISEAVARDMWAVAEGTHHGKPLLIRFRQELRSITDLTGYPLLLQITWPFAETDGTGLPDDPASSHMELFENRIAEAFERDCHAVLTAVITNDGSRQWLFYTSDIEECGRRLTDMPQERERYPIELTAEDDPCWTYLREKVLAGCK